MLSKGEGRHFFSDTVSDHTGHEFFCGEYDVEFDPPEISEWHYTWDIWENFEPKLREQEGYYTGVTASATFSDDDFKENNVCTTNEFDLEVLMCHPTFNDMQKKKITYDYGRHMYAEYNLPIRSYSPACKDYTQTNFFEAIDINGNVIDMPEWITWTEDNQTLSVYQDNTYPYPLIGQTFNF